MKKKLNTKLNMAKWIVALRTTRSKQSRYALRDTIGYCCLGIACNVSKLGKWENRETFGPGGSIYEFVIGKGDAQTRIANVLPSQVSNWLGLDETNPVVEDHAVEGAITASRANDSQDLSFKQIADLLEARYLPGEKAEDIVRKAKARAKKRLSAAK